MRRVEAADTSLLTYVARRATSAVAKLRIQNARRVGRFAGYGVGSEDSANLLIGAAIRRGEPFLAGRLGFHELDAIVTARGVRNRRDGSRMSRWLSVVRAEPSEWSGELVRCLHQVAGFFPTDVSMLERLAEVLVDAMSPSDILAVWFRRFEDDLMRKSAPSAVPILPRGLEPYYHSSPWTLALEGKRVLVIHPYEESIRSQFVVRDKLFGNKRVWPDCDLLTLKAVQSLAGGNGGFQSWFEALEYMKNCVDGIDYQVAIIGAGAYGLPLAAHVKRRGKMAIHMGGATQLLFGIAGKRWDERPEVANLYNPHWVRPSSSETPAAHKSVENGAYW